MPWLPVDSLPTVSRFCSVVTAGIRVMAAEVAGTAVGSDAVLVCSVGSLTVFDAAPIFWLQPPRPTRIGVCSCRFLGQSGGDQLPLHRCGARFHGLHGSYVLAGCPLGVRHTLACCHWAILERNSCRNQPSGVDLQWRGLPASTFKAPCFFRVCGLVTLRNTRANAGSRLPPTHR